MRSNIHDVAKRAEVSIASVSRVLNGSGYVSEEIASRVNQAVTELGYKYVVRDKKSKDTLQKDILGVIIPDINNPFFGEIIRGISKIAVDHDLSVFICNSDERPECELKNIESFNKLKAGGIIITPVSSGAEANTRLLETMQNEGVQVVLLDRDLRPANFDGVFLDNFKGAFDGVEALIQAGHKNIGIIAGPVGTKPGKDRLEGYFEAMRTYGLTINEEMIAYGDFKWDSGYNLTLKLMRKPIRPSAIFLSNNLMGLGCMAALTELLLKTPDDIALVVFDDEISFEAYSRNISVISRSAEQMGIEAAKIIVEKMCDFKKNNKHVPKRIILFPKLILRGSEIKTN